MNLKKLNEAVLTFKEYLKSDQRFDHLFLYESQKNWKNQWNLENLDLKTTFDESLKNSETRRLWVRDNYEPKAMMMKFMSLQKEMTRDMFRDLFDESKDVIGRADRFIFHCEVLLEEYKNLNRSSIDNRHFHDDEYQIISLYLAFQFPEIYSYYQFREFKRFLVHIGSLDIPKVNDLERYFKVMRTVYKFLERDDEVLELHQKRLNPDRHYIGKSLLLSHEMCRVVV